MGSGMVLNDKLRGGTVDDERRRAVVDQRDFHVSGEFSGFDRDALLLHSFDELGKHRFRDRGFGSAVQRRSPALSRGSTNSEVADEQDRATDFFDIAVEVF